MKILKDDDILNFESMMDELETDPVFLPSQFWRTVNVKNAAMLQIEGIENLKRTVSQNYYNWLITWPWDPQFRFALRDWIKNPSLSVFKGSIEKPLSIRLITGNQPIVLSFRARTFYRLFVSLIWLKLEKYDQRNLRELVSEPEVGNPIRIQQGGRLISQDLVNSIIECNVVAELIDGLQHRPKVAEVGAGYGRLAHVFSATQRGTYFIFDIPPALQVAEFYLSNIFPQKKIAQFRKWSSFDEVREEFESSDIVFCTANQIRKFPDGYFDVITSISTLPEMTQEQSQLFLSEFNRLARTHVFLKQWKIWTNTLDQTRLSSEDYSPGSDWELSLDRTDPINPKFFNQVWSRI